MTDHWTPLKRLFFSWKISSTQKRPRGHVPQIDVKKIWESTWIHCPTSSSFAWIFWIIKQPDAVLPTSFRLCGKQHGNADLPCKKLPGCRLTRIYAWRRNAERSPTDTVHAMIHLYDMSILTYTCTFYYCVMYIKQFTHVYIIVIHFMRMIYHTHTCLHNYIVSLITLVYIYVYIYISRRSPLSLDSPENRGPLIFLHNQHD